MPYKKRRRFTLEQCSRGGLNRPKRSLTLPEIVARFYSDRKGHVIAEGVTYSASGESHWQVRHSTDHAKQFDVLADGRRIAKSGARNLPTKWIRRRAKVAKAENTTYQALKPAI